jgi:hypothetical protein
VTSRRRLYGGGVAATSVGRFWTPNLRLATQLAFPHDVENHIAKSWIPIVPMRPPASDADVHFHIAGAWSRVTDLDERVPKIRTAFRIRKPGMKQADRLAVQGLQLITAQALVLPDGLEQTFRWRVRPVAQAESGAGSNPPLRVEGKCKVRNIRCQGMA